MNDYVFLTVCNTDRAKASTGHWRSARQRSMPPGRSFTSFRATTPLRSGTWMAAPWSSSTKADSTGVDAMSEQTDKLSKAADALIAATNAFDVESALLLFAPDAVIDDPSTGHCFDRHAGIRRYIEQYFVGYHTVTRLLSIERLG